MDFVADKAVHLLSFRSRRQAGLRCFFYFLLTTIFCCLSSTMVSAEPQADSTLQHIKVQLKWRHQFQFAGYYAAKELGYYRDAGLDVELIERTSSTTPIDQLMGGRVDFAVADSGVLLYRSNGVPLVVLAAIFQHSPSVLITPSNITDLTQLRHKRAMLSGGFNNAELITMLQKAGVSIDDIEVLPPNTSVAALINGDTEAYNGYTTNEPYLLKKEGFAFNVFKPRDYGVDFYGDVLITNQATIKRDPQMVAAFRQASLRGWQYAVDHPSKVVDMILAHYNSQHKSREHLLFEAQASRKLVFSDIVPIGYVNKERWQRIEAVFQQQGLLNQPIDYNHFLYTSQSPESLLDMLYQYRMQVGGSLVLLFGLLIVLHNMHLRREVALRTQQLNDARIQAEVEARTDSLTGLPNRRYFFESGEQAVGQAERRGVDLSLISLDLDYFKQVNDTYGHAAGDIALIEVAKCLKQEVRKDDVVARLGGEEFSIICLGSGLSNVEVLAERIRQSIQNCDIYSGDHRFSCTVSIGIASWQPGDSFEAVVKKADLVLYKAKESGRNQVKNFS